MKSSQNSFEAPNGRLSCSIRLEDHFFPNWETKKFFSFENSHSAEKCKRGTLWDLTYILLQNIKKLEGGPF